MINVPARVMDALRDGRRLKEYLFCEVLEEGMARTDANGALNGMMGNYLFSVNQVSTGKPSAVVSYTQNGDTITETVYPMDGNPLAYRITIPTDSTNQSIIFKESTTALAEIDLYYIKAGITIGNNNLVTESVKIDERMSSGDRLKFGLCEGASLEFQYFDKPSLTDKRIKAYVNVQYKDENEDLAWYMIPMGFFDVDKCPRQVSTGIFKVTAYNKLRSSYLDAKANQQIIDYVGSREGQSATVFGILKDLLSNFKIISNRGDPIEFSYTVAADSYWYIDANASFWNIGFICGGLKITITPSSYSNLRYYSYQIPTAALSRWIESQLYADPIYEININDEFVIPMTDAMYDSHYKITPATFYFKELMYVTGYTNIGPTRLIYPENMTQEQVTKWAVDNIQITQFKDTEVYVTNITNEPLSVFIPCVWSGQEEEFTPHHAWTPWPETLQALYNSMVSATGGITAEHIENSPIDEYVLTLADVEAFPDVTLRDLQSAEFEIGCQYGKLDREQDAFYGETLNNSRLLPADTLYPANNLYPGGWSEGGYKSQYSKLWTDSQGKLTFRYLIITYKGLDENNQAKDFTLQRTVNSNGNTDYYMSDNWLLKNLIWTAEQVGAYADEMVSLMQNVSWIPFEMWAAGLPYLETGDEIEITTSEGTFTSYILQRQLNGIQNLQDTYINGTLDVF